MLNVQDIMLKMLKCPICQDYCNNPVEFSCCKTLYCKKDALKINQCAVCRMKDFSFIESTTADRMIKMLPSKCDYCNYKCTLGDLNEHFKNCDLFPLTCPIAVCKSKFNQFDLFKHFIEIHRDEFIRKKEEILNLLGSTSQNLNSPDNSIPSIDAKINQLGNSARLGETGKYYCGKLIDGLKCNCCDIHCGLEDGCNCSPCMEIDILSRNLPRGWLVYQDGFAAKKSGKFFYCGRLVEEDGYCGPYKGSQCNSCKLLNKQTENGGRYAKLV